MLVDVVEQLLVEVVELAVVVLVGHSKIVAVAAVVDIDQLVETSEDIVDAFAVAADMDYHKEHNVEDCKWTFVVEPAVEHFQRIAISGGQ